MYTMKILFIIFVISILAKGALCTPALISSLQNITEKNDTECCRANETETDTRDTRDTSNKSYTDDTYESSGIIPKSLVAIVSATIIGLGIYLLRYLWVRYCTYGVDRSVQRHVDVRLTEHSVVTSDQESVERHEMVHLSRANVDFTNE